MPEPSDRFRQMVSTERGLDALGILPGDLLLIDVTLRPTPGCLVVVTVHGRFVARRWDRTSGMVHLTTGGVAGPEYHYHHPREVDLYGVITAVMHRTWPVPKRWMNRRPQS